jgi:RNA-binding protein 26
MEEQASGKHEDVQGGDSAPRPVVVKVPSALARLAGRYDEHEDDESEDEEGGRGNRRGRRSKRSQSPPERFKKRLQLVQEEGGGRGPREGWRGRGGGRSNGRMDGLPLGGARGRFGGRGDDHFRGRGMPDGRRWDGPPAPGPRFDPLRGPIGEWGPVKPDPGFAPGRFEPRPDFPHFVAPPFPPGPMGRGMPLPPGPDFGHLPRERPGPPFFGGAERWEAFDLRRPPPGSEYEMRMRLMRGMERRPEGELRQQKCPEFFGERGYCLRGRLCPYDHGEDVEVVKDEQALRQLSLARKDKGGGAEGGERQPGEAKEEDDLPQHEFERVEGGGKAEARLTKPPGEDEAYDPDTPLWDEGGGGERILGHGRRLADASGDMGLQGGDSDAVPLANTEAGPSGRPNLPLFAPGGYLNPQRQGFRGAWGAGQEGRFPGGVPEFEDIRSEVGENEKTLGGRGRGFYRGPDRQGGRGSGQKGGRGRGRGPPGEQPQADKTLFVTGIPAEQNTVGNLLKHFKKYGHVVIRPFGGDKAHVLFESHGEAEKALQSPDAVMGNRFIRLYWAKEELDLEKMGGKYGTKKAAEGLEDDAKSSADDKPPGKPAENGISKGHAYIRPGSEKGPPKGLTDAQKVAHEKAVLALKIKQLEATVLEAKIAEQRRALAELEKKTGRASSAGQELKRAGSSSAEGDNQPAGKKPKLGGTPAPAAPWVKKGWAGAGGFKSHLKLDNRSTVLDVLGELPTGANKEALRMHFWRFGEVVTVQVPETGSSDAAAGVAAKVVFRQRHDAEAALVEGKEWEGQSMKLVWGAPFKAAAVQPAPSPKPQIGVPSEKSAGKPVVATTDDDVPVASSLEAQTGHQDVIRGDEKYRSQNGGIEDVEMEAEATNGS